MTQPASQPRILVADDSDPERAATCSALIAGGYAVIEARDGPDAVEIFARERPDLVVLDVVMPRMDGLEVCRLLRAIRTSTYVPILITSGRNEVRDRVDGLRAGADDYLGKPYEAVELAARVGALLRAHREVSGPGRSASVPDAQEPKARHRIREEFDRAERYADPLACLRAELSASSPTEASIEGPRGDPQWFRELVESNVRRIDLVFRTGARGFLLLLPNTHFPGALTVAERIWRGVRERRGPEVSVGVAFYPNRDVRSPRDLETLVELALDNAKREGGSKICLYQHQGYLYTPQE